MTGQQTPSLNGVRVTCSPLTPIECRAISMRRSWFIVVAGLIVALAAYAGIYFTSTAKQHALEQSNQPTLSWLQQEYHLSNDQFARVQELYAAYQPKCAEMCRRIDEQNAEVKNFSPRPIASLLKSRKRWPGPRSFARNARRPCSRIFMKWRRRCLPGKASVTLPGFSRKL